MPDDRPLRADARRNRDHLIEVAVRAFSAETSGTASRVSLDAIAKEAGVGIGTLYRHFPTREALVEAAYRSELAKLCESVPGLLESMRPEVALRAWMDLFVAYMAAKRGLADALREVIASGLNPYEHSRDLLLTALGTLLAAGPLRTDVAPADVLASMSGITLASRDPEQSARLLDLLMDGLRA